MSNPLTGARKAARDLLVNAGVRAFVSVPEAVIPPAVWVAPDEPYLPREGRTFGSQVVCLSLVLAVEWADNEKQAEALDDLALRVGDVFADADDFTLGDTGSVGSFSLNKQSYLGCAVSVATEIQR